MTKNLPALLTELEGLLKESKLCEACGEESIACYDSNGEGLFWLCDARNPVHSESVYCGTLVYRKPYFGTKLNERNSLPLLIEALREALKIDMCDCATIQVGTQDQTDPITEFIQCRYCKWEKKYGITDTEGG